MNDIHNAPSEYKEDFIEVNEFGLDEGLERYREAVADFEHKKTLAFVKTSLQEVLKKIENCEVAIDDGASDKMQRKRLAEEAIERHRAMWDGLSRRLKRGPGTGGEDDLEVEHREESQELGTITL